MSDLTADYLVPISSSPQQDDANTMRPSKRLRTRNSRPTPREVPEGKDTAQAPSLPPEIFDNIIRHVDSCAELGRLRAVSLYFDDVCCKEMWRRFLQLKRSAGALSAKLNAEQEPVNVDLSLTPAPLWPSLWSLRDEFWPARESPTRSMAHQELVYSVRHLAKALAEFLYVVCASIELFVVAGLCPFFWGQFIDTHTRKLEKLAEEELINLMFISRSRQCIRGYHKMMSDRISGNAIFEQLSRELQAASIVHVLELLQLDSTYLQQSSKGDDLFSGIEEGAHGSADSTMSLRYTLKGYDLQQEDPSPRSERGLEDEGDDDEESDEESQDEADVDNRQEKGTWQGTSGTLATHTPADVHGYLDSSAISVVEDSSEDDAWSISSNRDTALTRSQAAEGEPMLLLLGQLSELVMDRINHPHLRWYAEASRRPEDGLTTVLDIKKDTDASIGIQVDLTIREELVRATHSLQNHAAPKPQEVRQGAKNFRCGVTFSSRTSKRNERLVADTFGSEIVSIVDVE